MRSKFRTICSLDLVGRAPQCFLGFETSANCMFLSPTKRNKKAEELKAGSILVTFTKGLDSKAFEILSKRRFDMSWGACLCVFVRTRIKGRFKIRRGCFYLRRGCLRPIDAAQAPFSLFKIRRDCFRPIKAVQDPSRLFEIHQDCLRSIEAVYDLSMLFEILHVARRPQGYVKYVYEHISYSVCSFVLFVWNMCQHHSFGLAHENRRSARRSEAIEMALVSYPSRILIYDICIVRYY